MSNSRNSGLPASAPYIIGNEFAERFSYYGMNAVLMVYMTSASYLAMPKEEAAGWIHLFKGAVYFFPLLGALLADVFFGKFRIMLSFSLVYCLGHLALALPGGWFNDMRMPLFWGLALIAFGAGGIKSCTSAIVGDQFTAENQHLMSRVYNWFYLAINGGSFISMLLTPWLMKHWGPEWAFGVPGVLMGCATLILWVGRKKYRIVPPSGIQFLHDLQNKESLWILGKVSLIFLFLIIFWAVYEQTTTLWVAQAQNMNPKILESWVFLPESWKNWALIPSQIQALNPLLILILIPIFTRWVYPWWERIFGTSTLKKIAVGLFLATVAQCFPLWFEISARNGIVLNLGWQILAYLILTTAEVLVSVTSLEFAYTQAPRSMKALVLGVYLLTTTAGNFLVAGINFLAGTFPSLLAGDAYYRFFLVLALINALLFLVAVRFYRENVILQE